MLLATCLLLVVASSGHVRTTMASNDPVGQSLKCAKKGLGLLDLLWRQTNDTGRVSPLEESTKLWAVAAQRVFESVQEGYAAILTNNHDKVSAVRGHLRALKDLSHIQSLPIHKWFEVVRTGPEGLLLQHLDSYLEAQIIYWQSYEVLTKYASSFARDRLRTPETDGVLVEKRDMLIGLWKTTIRFTLQGAEITALATAAADADVRMYTSAELMLKVVSRLQRALANALEILNCFEGNLDQLLESLPMMSREAANVIEARLLFDIKAVSMIERVRRLSLLYPGELSTTAVTQLESQTENIYGRLGHFALVLAPQRFFLLNRMVLEEKALIPLEPSLLESLKARITERIELDELPQQLEHAEGPSENVLLRVADRLKALEHSWTEWQVIAQDLRNVQRALKCHQLGEVVATQLEARKLALAELETMVYRALQQAALELPVGKIRNDLHLMLLNRGYLVPIACARLRAMEVLPALSNPLDFSTCCRLGQLAAGACEGGRDDREEEKEEEEEGEEED